VGLVCPGDDEGAVADSLDELSSLLETLRIPVVDRIVQRRQRPTAHCLLGTGKVYEIRDIAAEKDVGLIVFDHQLAAPQVRNLETMIGKQVVDRTGVILEIFSRHARSNQAKTQVEIARMEYLLPRLAGAWTHFQRQAGGGVVRGMGEKQIEIDRRRARDRIAKLSRQLVQIQRDRATQRRARSKELKVAIVGYTNSGKTTIMKMLTRVGIGGCDELFATLDTNIKTIDPRTRPKILLSDTVGFIRNLPHSLVASFKSTLDEVSEADLLLHVVDVSHDKYRDHIATTQGVLAEIGAKDIPSIMVFNKVDRLEDHVLPRILLAGWPGSIVVSAIKNTDGERLREHIYEYFKKNFVQARIAVGVEEQAVQSLVYNYCLVLETDYTNPGQVIFSIQTTRPVMAKLTSLGVKETSQLALGEG
jgi:GTP-binding protein HflX